MSKNPLLHTLIQMTGQKNVITVHRPFVEFTGSLEAAMMLGQLLYWTPKSSMGGWIAKTDIDWQDELFLSRYAVRSATKILDEMDLVETKIKKFNGAPTKHYRVKWEILESKWVDYLNSNNGLSEIEQSDYAESDNPLSEKEQSLTEITAEITIDSPNDEFSESLEQDRELITESKEQRGDPLEGWLEALRMQPGIKKSVRLEEIHELFCSLLDTRVSYNKWERFYRFVDEQEQKKGRHLHVFMRHLFEDEEFSMKYWNPEKMIEAYPEAFPANLPNNVLTDQQKREGFYA